MTRAILFNPFANHELLEIVGWYDMQETGLSEIFEVELAAALNRLQRNPYLGSIVYRQIVRRARMQRFPYHIFYSVGPQFIRILTIVHMHRRPTVWRGRVKSRIE